MKIAFFSDIAMPFVISTRERSDGAISLYCELVAPASPAASLGQPLHTQSRGVGRADPRPSPASRPGKKLMLFVQRSINNRGFQQHWLSRLSLSHLYEAVIGTSPSPPQLLAFAGLAYTHKLLLRHLFCLPPELAKTKMSIYDTPPPLKIAQ